MFSKVWPQNMLSIRFCSIFRCSQFSENEFPAHTDMFSEKLEVQIIALCIFMFLDNIMLSLADVAPYGSTWAHTKPGWSPMAHDHF